MAIYTQRGLKIRVAVPYVFGLMARLNPKVSPFRILKTTEGIESLPVMLAFVVGIVAFVLPLPALEIGIVVAARHFMGKLINLRGFSAFPGHIATQWPEVVSRFTSD
jgi:hypothetical protein